jgi:hypothetical protein
MTPAVLGMLTSLFSSRIHSKLDPRSLSLSHPSSSSTSSLTPFSSPLPLSLSSLSFLECVSVYGSVYTYLYSYLKFYTHQSLEHISSIVLVLRCLLLATFDLFEVPFLFFTENKRIFILFSNFFLISQIHFPHLFVKRCHKESRMCFSRKKRVFGEGRKWWSAQRTWAVCCHSSRRTWQRAVIM